MLGQLNIKATKIKIKQQLGEIGKTTTVKFNVDTDNVQFKKSIKEQKDLYLEMHRVQEAAENRRRARESQHNKLVEQDIQKKINDELKLSKTQEIANLKNIQYDKQTISIYSQTSSQLKKIKEDALATTEVMKHFGGTEFKARAKSLNNELNKINITQDMTQKEMKETILRAKEVGHSLGNVSKEAKATGNNAMKMGEMFKTAVPKFIA